MKFSTGTLVHSRGRDWVVLPSADENLLRLKPLGARDEDVTGIYLPLVEDGYVRESQFPLPAVSDLGSVRSARLLYDASRLSLRSAAGPFRCAAKLGFRPRSYQMVPLIMALKQKEPIRLMIADDVGVGKTVEALLIVKELLERREIRSFAVLCPPHLCEQWQTEIKDKFQIDAVIIRTNTQTSLDRKIVNSDVSVFQHYPYQVVSIDYIKGENRYSVYANEAPDLVIVDEAHTCAQGAGATSSQQLRHRLVKALGQKPNQNLILMSATPHSGKEDEFRSLLGLLKPEFAEAEWDGEGKEDFRQTLAQHFIQRRRGNIVTWLDETTPFPKRETLDAPYKLKADYRLVYGQVVALSAQLMTVKPQQTPQNRFRYWSALALLRGVMSSPRAGVKMLINRAHRAGDDGEVWTDNPHIEQVETVDDELPTTIIDKTEFSGEERKSTARIAEALARLEGIEFDAKLETALKVLKAWLKEGYSPVIFCRYIETAKSVAEHLQQAMGKTVLVDCVTSEDPDEVRRDRIGAMIQADEAGKNKVLVATDCLSEGINLQALFNAVLHYDLPWNPNRLEQREGRVDRFGQTRPVVKTCLLFGEDNPMDQVVLKVLYAKAKRIRDRIGVSIPFPEDSKAFLDTIFQAVLAEAEKLKRSPDQMELFSLDEMVRSEQEMDRIMEAREKKDQAIQSIFAQKAIKAQDIEQDLRLTDEAVGRPEIVYRFVRAAFSELWGTPFQADEKALTLTIQRSSFPEPLVSHLPVKQKGPVKLAFRSPVPDGFVYWGRNHGAVETLCQLVLARSLQKDRPSPVAARSSVVVSGAVTERTVVYVLRARHVLEDLRRKSHWVAEEVLCQGVSGPDRIPVDAAVVEALMANPRPLVDLPPEVQAKHLERELSLVADRRPIWDQLAFARAEELLKQHERYYKALGTDSRSSKLKIVEPVIPMDVTGIYVFLPGGAS